MAEYIHKEDVQRWLIDLEYLILREQESGVIDMGKIKELLNSIMHWVENY